MEFTTSLLNSMLDAGSSMGPVFIGQRPPRSSGLSHGFSFWVKTLKPYTITRMSAVTFPVMVETPLISKVRVLLSGVRAKRKSVAEKLEFSMQLESDLDSMTRSADVKGARARRRRERRSDMGEGDSERRMVGCIKCLY